MPRISSALAAMLFLCSGCIASDSRARHTAAIVGDSAGVTIVDNGPLARAEMIDPLGSILEIGAIEGEPEYQFFRVGDAKRLADGAIAVTNSGTRELRIYESDGTHRVTAGGAGNGPAEFGYPTTLVLLPGDTIQVQDRLDRVHFTVKGEFVRRETGDRQALTRLTQTAGGFSEGGSWLGDGSYFAPVYARSDSPSRPGPPFRPQMTFVRVAPRFDKLDTLGQFGGILQQYVDVGGRRGVSAFVPPFATNTAWALGSADGTVAVGDNATPQIHRFHPNGTRSIVRWSGEVVRVTEREVEEWKDRQRNASWTRDQLPELERAWATMDIPRTKPYYDRPTIGSDGTLWITADDSDSSTTMLVFAPDGRFERTVRFPGRFRVFDSGQDWVLGVLRDESEVEYVHMYKR